MYKKEETISTYNIMTEYKKNNKHKYILLMVLSLLTLIGMSEIVKPLTAEAKFTVYFNGNGGNTPNPSSKTITSGTAIGTLPTVTRTGHNFKAFFTTSASTGGSQIWTTTKFTKVVAKTHKVTSGDTLWDLAGRYLGDSTKYPTLASWNKISSGATLSLGQVLYVSDPALAKSTATYYARWEVASYTYSFNGNGSTNGASITKTYNSAVGTLPTTAWGSRTFNGWWTARTGGTKLSTTEKMTANKVFYAQWILWKHTVAYNLNGGTGTSTSQTKTTGTAMSVHGAPTLSGYSFTGWLNSKDGKIYAAGANYPNDYNGGTVTMTAQWSAWKHTVAYNLNGGAGTSTAQTKTTGVALNLHGAPTRSGYTFAGWKSDKNNTVYAGGASYTPDYNGGTATMVAQWTPNTYQVTYNANGGANAPATQNFVFNSGATISSTIPTRLNYTFRHWTYTTNTFTPGQAIPVGWGSFSLTAQWAPFQHTVKYNLNSGTGTATTQTKTADVQLNLHGTPTRAGHTFTGWLSSRNGVKYGAGANYTPDYNGGETTMTAQWTANRTVSFNANGGTAPSFASRVVTSGSAFGSLPTTTRTGYTFNGWFTATTGGTKLATTTIITTDIIYYAQWTSNNFTFTFNANGGTAPSSATITRLYGTAVGALPTTTKVGHSFAGWWTTSAASGGTQLTTATAMTANTTYYARWNIDSYTFSFNGNGGSNGASITKVYNTAVGALPTSTRTGYTFNGWFNTTAATGGTQVTTGTLVTANTAYYARWTINQYTATFNANGGVASTPTTIVKNYNTQLGTLPTTTRSGYYFNGWYTAASGGTKIATTTVITNNVTYYAQWLQNRTVTFNANGGNAPNIASKIVPNGHQIGTLATISRTGHTFNGWFTATTAGTQLATTTIITADITYYARWTAINYTATFNANGGNAPSVATITKAYGLQLGTLPTITRSGYTFNGWFTATSGGSKVATTTTVTANVTYYAQWTINRTVTFNANGGNAPSFTSRVLTSGTAFGSLPTIIRTGHTFNGWFTATTAGTKLATTTIINADVVYYAQWSINTYTFTFNAQGGNGPTPATIAKPYNTAVGALPTSAKTGYILDGWYTAASGGTKLLTTTLVTTNTIYYAQWTPSTYTITYNANGGTGAPANQSFSYNTGAKLSTTKPTRTGYTFTHWLNGTTTLAPGAAIPTGWGNTTVAAQWAINTYTFTFNNNGGGTPSQATIAKTYNSQVGTLPTIERAGYTFRGWWTTNAASGGTQLTTATTMTANTTYYARWVINRTVTFNANGGTATSPATRIVTSGDAVGTFPSTTRTGYTFTGWFTAASAGTAVTATTVVNADVIYYAQWKINTYTVIWNGNGGTNPANTTKDYNLAVGTLPTTTRTGYTFNGWWTVIATTGGTQIASTTLVTNNVTYYARWTINNYTVNFNANGGSAVASKQYNYNTQLGTLPATTQTGYTHNGWFTAATSGTAITATTVVTGNITYYAQWTINRYTATFNGNGGSNGASITNTYNSALGTLPTSTYAGYYFNGWFTAATGGSKVATTTKLTANVTYYAQWLANRTVTFNQNGGDAPSFASKIVPNTHQLGTLPTVARTGHTFTGWFTAASGGTKISETTVISANIIYYAQWTINTYTFTFNSNGGSTPTQASIIKNYNIAVGALPTTTRTGYTFHGWWTTNAASGGTQLATTTLMTANTAYYARWTINNYTVHFNANGGNAVASKGYVYNTQLGTLPTTARTGYTFNGWFTAATGGTQIASTTLVTNTITYYAQWTINAYTATFNGNGGSNGASITKNYNTALGTLPTSAYAGHYFNGWFTTTTGGTKIATTTLLTANVTYYAQWLVNRTVTFNQNGGNAPSFTSKIVPTTHQVGAFPTVTRTGYAHTGWFTAATSGTKVSETTVISANITYYAQWTANNYTATFNANGGTVATPATITKLYNTAIGTLPTTTYANHYFNGWFTAATGGTKIATTTLVTNNVTYYAQWLQNRTVTYNANGGNAPSFASKIVPTTHTVGTLPTITRTGHTFNGWFTAATGGTKIATNTVVSADVIFYAQWTRNEFTVTWNGNGGTSPASKMVGYDVAVGTLPTTTLANHTFLGWYTAATGGTKISATTLVKANVTFYAQWVINRTVTFNSQGGSVVASKTVTNGTVLATLTTPTRTGYTFNGWFTAATGGTKVVTPLTVSADMNLHAQWTINNYTVTFNAQGGSAVASKGYPYNTAVGTLPTPTRTGYTLNGWYTAATGGTKIATSTLVTSNITYHAQWTINTYTATFNGNGGSNGLAITKDYNTELGTLPLTTQVGHTFNGWFTSRTGGTQISTKTLLTNDVTYYAQWTAINYTVTFDVQGGTTVASIVRAYNTAVGTLPTTTKAGHHFEGWFTAINGGGSKVSTSTRVLGNVTYYAYWIVNRTVTFDANGGTATTPVTKTIVHNRGVGDLPTTTRTGYTFNGWFTSRTGGTQVSQATIVTSDITYYAQWTAINYTVTFDVQGGTTVASIVRAYNTAVGTLPTTTKTGHHFEGWFTAVNGGGSKVTTSTKVYGNVTYYAYWIVNRTVTFNSNGGTVPTPATKTIVHNREVGTLPTVTRTGYILDGWFTSRTTGTKVTDKTLVTSDITYYAQWTAINYTVTYDVQGGSTVTPEVKAYDTQLGTLPTTTKAGHHFEGWFTAINGGGAKVTTSTKVYGNVTYYAYWIINRTVTFNANNGTTPSFATKVVVHNRAIGALPTTTRTGYTFTGWFTGRESGTKLLETTLITSDVTYYANWTPIKYTIIYDAQGGSVVANQQKDYDTSLGVLPTTTRTGYTFLGWFTGANGAGSEITTRTMVKGNATYYAKWVINRTVTYQTNGGTIVQPVTVTDMTVLQVLPETTYTGHTFLGWFTAATGGTKVEEPLTVNANMVLHAQWRVNDYLVTFNANGGSGVSTSWHTFNKAIGSLPTTTRTGYTFQGWFTALTGGTKITVDTIITNNVTYYAQWVINEYTVTWDTNGGEAVAPRIIKYNNELGTLPGSNKVGHTLDGWYTERNSGTMITSATKITNNVTYYASWTPVTYTVTWDVQSGLAVAPSRVVYNTSVGVLPETTRSGYHFEGWFTAINGGGAKVTVGTRIYGNTTYYAYWIENRTVTFNTNGGTAPNPTTKTIVHGRALGTLPATTRTGYTLAGWFTAKTGGTRVTEATLVVEDTTYYAQWTPLKYTITFDAQGGTAVTTQTHAHDSKLGILPVTTRSGYYFEGWFTAINGGGTQITDRTTVSGPATYYAYWIVNRVVTFDLNGGTTQSIATKVVPHNKAFGTLPTATRTGHTFNGWFTGKTSGTKLLATTLITSDITYYAQWTPIMYTVRFDPTGGLGVDDRKVAYDTGVGALPHTARKGYVFRGWYTAASGGSEITERTKVMGNTTYFARWDDHINVTFNQNGGRFGLVAMRVPVGTTIPQLREMIKVNDFNMGRLVHASKVFSNILIEEPATLKSANVLDGVGFEMTQDVTATVQWSDVVTMDITTGSSAGYRDFTTFSHNTTKGITGAQTVVSGSKTIKRLTLDLSKTGTPITSFGTNSNLVMSIEGYTINGFKVAGGGQQVDKGMNNALDIALWNTRSHIDATFASKETPRIELEAVASRIELAVKFDTQLGVAIPDAMVYYGDTLTPLPTTTRTHYDLQGWYTEPSGKGVKLTTSYVFKAPATYYAHWTPKNYIIKYDAQGGSTVPNKTVVYNNQIGALPTPTRAGYLLLGWYTQKEGMGTKVTDKTLATGNVTYYAHWTDTVQIRIQNIDTTLETLNVKIGTTYKQLLATISSRDDILVKLRRGNQHAMSIYMYNKGTSTVVGSLTGVYEENNVITTHMDAKVVWTNFINYYITTGPSVNYKPFDSITMTPGDKQYYNSVNTKTHTTGTHSGKTLTHVTYNTVALGSPMKNVGALTNLQAEVEGYEITGWKNTLTGVVYNANLTDPMDVEIFWGADAIRQRLNGGNLEIGLEAQLRRISYKVTFDATGGSSVPQQEIYHGAKLINITVPTRSKYVFKGWYTQPGGKGEQLTLDTVIKSNRTYYAHWNEILTINFDTQGGSGPIPARSFESGNAVGTLPLTSLNKHRFVGWYTQPGGQGERVTASRVPAKDEVYYAYWIEQMTVIIKDGQTELNRFVVDKGSKVPYLPTVTREGHTLIGWVNSSDESIITTDTPIMEDMTVLAKFGKNVTVTFNTQGGTAVANLQLISGDVLPNLTEPTRAEYNFSGWYTQPGGNGPMYREGVPVYDDLTLYAHWTDDEFRIDFDTRGGTPAEHILVIKGGSVGLDGRTEREGYRFMGWYTEPEYKNPVSNLYKPTKSVTLYARWELIKIYEVKFNTNFSLTIPNMYIKENTAIEKMPAPKREGYGFLGWYIDPSFMTQVYEGYMPIQNTELHAKWVKNTELITVTFSPGNTEVNRTYQAAVGQKLPASYYQTPSRAGYRFVGWYVGNTVANADTVFTADTTVTARWEVRGNYDEGKYPSNPSLLPNLNPKPWVPSPYLDHESKPVGELVQEIIITTEEVNISEASSWLKAITKVTLTTGRQKQVIYGDE